MRRLSSGAISGEIYGLLCFHYPKAKQSEIQRERYRVRERERERERSDLLEKLKLKLNCFMNAFGGVYIGREIGNGEKYLNLT